MKLLRALCFLLKSFYFFFNRIARYAQSKETRNLSSKIPQITCKAIFRSCLYYMLIPLSWTIMLDIYIQYPLFSYTLVVVWIGIMIGIRGKFITWSDWAFNKSVDFLNYFNRWGGNYVLNSVVICVVVPVAIYVVLILLIV